MNDHIDLVSEPEYEDGGREQDVDSAENDAINEIDQLRLELDQSKNRALRALADLENYRARVNRQSADERKYANIDLMREMLTVWDNIGRALEAVDKTHNLDSLVEGVKMVYRQFLDVLAKFQCEKIETLHQPFDPNFHQSIAQLPNDEYPANTIIEETQAGFRLHDRVVRPSQVVLSAGKAETK